MGNCGILVKNIGIILKKFSLSCGQHFRGHINTKMSWILCVVTDKKNKFQSKEFPEFPSKWCPTSEILHFIKSSQFLFKSTWKLLNMQSY